MLENNGLFGKTMFFRGENNVFVKAMFFDTTSHMIYFDYKAYMHFIKIKLFMFYMNFFHNTIPHRSHSLIGHVIQEL